MRTLKKIKRRLWAVLLCLCMFLSSFAFVNTAYTMDDDSGLKSASEIEPGTETSLDGVGGV